jgi:hypothetical protein
MGGAMRQNHLILPAGWRRIKMPFRASADHYAKAFASNNGLRVLITYDQYDGQKWAHISMSRSDRLPSWADVRKVKDLFIGSDEKAIMVLPPDSEYVNAHPFCFHLFCNLDSDPLPDFTRGLGIL